MHEDQIEEDIYNRRGINIALEDDEISAEEEGFLLGYREAIESNANSEDNAKGFFEEVDNNPDIEAEKDN